MSKEAPGEMMRYGPMRDWLKDNRIPESETRKLIAAGVIKQGRLRKPSKRNGKVRAWYSASQIQRDVLNKSNGSEKES